MAAHHAFGYSKSIRAKCHGPPPCKGTPLSMGTLRYGQTISNEYGENVEWRHWGCVTPDILNQLATVDLSRVAGFSDISANDQARIRSAVQLQRIDPADVPASAKPKHIPAHLSATQLSRQNKRKAKDEPPRPSTSRVAFAQPSPSERSMENIEDEPQETETVDELYCIMNTNVVGIQYYDGLVGPGEEVLLVREPNNHYDRNAIQVKNISNIQVGHINKKVAAKLAPLLDSRAVTVEGVINDGNLGRSSGFTLSLTLKIYGPADKRDILEPHLIWATPGQRGFRQRNDKRNGIPSASTSTIGISAAQQEMMRKQQGAIQAQQEALRKAAELKQMIDGLEKVDDEGRRNSVLDTLCSTEDILSLPLHPNPPGVKKGDLKVDLMKHQSQALQWCIEREFPVLPQTENGKPVQFWQYKTIGGKTYYLNLATKSPQNDPPVLGRGAICADAMGLGKTLTMISLILATKGDQGPGISKTTLVVAPLSVLSNWEKQIEDHCVPGALSTYVYYGNNRGVTAEELQQYDIVITTYQTITGEYGGLESAIDSRKKRRTIPSLFDVRWKRIILDEGHCIRNQKTKMAKSVFILEAERRWVLSGTPIINSPKDLGSLLRFLQICRPLDNEDFFKRLLLRPLKDALPSGVELLRALMNQCCLRRTKEMQDSQGNPLIPLPPVEVIKVPVTLPEETRKLYDEVECLSSQRFEDYLHRADTQSFAQSNILGMLTRMRQLALHPGLLPANYLEELRQPDNFDVEHSRPTPITQEKRIHLQDILAQAIEDCEECPICFDIMKDPRITHCAHKFCLDCITEAISRIPKCPMDRQPISLNDLIEPPPPTELTQRPVREFSPELSAGKHSDSSAKIEQLIHLLKLSPSSEKSLVFSQFTAFLDKIGEALEEAGISYVRFDGKMSAKRRQEAIARFSVPVESKNPTSSSKPTRSIQNRGKGKAKMAILDDFEDDENDSDFMSDNGFDEEFSEKHNPRVMLISLKAGALGLNLTVANNVYLMDPWWQEGIESQAIDRVNRIGQKKPVHVYQLIAENTVESKVLEIQERKKKLIKEAFSGTKTREAQREQREARLQDLIEIFGRRTQNADQDDD